MQTEGQFNRSSRSVVGVLAILVLAGSACNGAEGDSSASDQARMEIWGTSDMQFRRIAQERPRPEYPTVSLNSGQTGVAVAEVVTTAGGSTGQVEILEAPDEHIGDAVTRALAQWKVQLPTDDDGQAVRVRAKLFFYFVIEDGE